MPPKLAALGLRAVLWALLLFWPGAPWLPAFAAAFREVGDAIAGQFMERFDVRLSANVLDASRPEDTGADVRGLTCRHRFVVPCDSRGMAYLPVALFLTLVLATPMPMPRRFRVLGLGLPVLVAYVGVRLFLRVLFAQVMHFSVCPTPRATTPSLDPGSPAHGWLNLVNYDPMVFLTPPVLLWLALCWRDLAGRPASANGAGRPALRGRS